MPLFESPYFTIELPPETVDASSYCFALPASDRFHPSVVIKFDQLPKDKPLGIFVEGQVKKMREQLKNFLVLSGPKSDTQTQISLQCEWGDGSSRFRQTFVFRQQGARVYTITGTLREGPGLAHAAMLNAAIASFHPR